MPGKMETPSRIWRRMQEVEEREMPSLPSMPHFEDSQEQDPSSNYIDQDDDQDDSLQVYLSAPLHSTPTPSTHSNTNRFGSITRSTAHFANSIASRSSKSSRSENSSARKSQSLSRGESFEASVITSLPVIHPVDPTGHYEDDSILDDSDEFPDVHLPHPGSYMDEDDDLSLSDALQSVSRAGSPAPVLDPYEKATTAKKTYDISGAQIDAKISPFDKHRHIALKRTAAAADAARLRTPSLTRTSSSDGSMSSNSTPYNTRSFESSQSQSSPVTTAARVPLPHSVNPSPALSARGQPASNIPAVPSPVTSRFAASPPQYPSLTARLAAAIASPIPGSNVPLPRSRTASPAVFTPRERTTITTTRDQEEVERQFDRSASEHGMRSMDMTDIHVSPQVIAEVARTAYYQQVSEESQREEEESEREPSFTSESGASTSPSPYQRAAPRSSPYAVPVSSPLPSFTMTPTPAFPRPRARFDLPLPSADLRARDDSEAQDEELTDEEAESRETGQYDQDDDDDETERTIQHTQQQSLNEETPRPTAAAATNGGVATPRTQRRSFFLSIINSTARPRPKMTTPHPRRDSVFATPSIAESTPSLSSHSGSGSGSGSASASASSSAYTSSSLSSASNSSPPVYVAASAPRTFSAITPRPRSAGSLRAAHPLSQATGLSAPADGADEDGSPSTASSAASVSTVAATPATGWAAREPPTTVKRVAWATPGPVVAAAAAATAAASTYSPYDGASFISTASSHDLTTHQRANTSFDPSMGFGAGAPGQGVGRFNATKLNTYLHGLNRRLQEENELLLGRVHDLEVRAGDGDGDNATTGVTANANANASGAKGSRASLGGNKRLSLGGAPILGDVAEDVSIEERAEMEEMLGALKDELARALAERDELAKVLEDEAAARTRDKEVWKERMAETMTPIIKELKAKVEVAEQQGREESTKQVRELERRVEALRSDLQLMSVRAEKAEAALEAGMDLGGEMKKANEEIARVRSELREAHERREEAEAEADLAHGQMKQLEAKFKEERNNLHHLEDELHAKAEDEAAFRHQAQSSQNQARALADELQTTKEYAAELETGATAAVEKIEALSAQLHHTDDELQQLAAERDEVNDLNVRIQTDIQKSQDIVRNLEEALGKAEAKMLVDEGERADLRKRVQLLEKEREKLREAASSLRLSAGSGSGSSRNDQAAVAGGPTEEDLDDLEQELGEAHKEIARLNMLLQQSPARKAMDKAKDAKIELLEREREELLERNKALRVAVSEIHTPGKAVTNTSGISPIHRQVLAMSVRSPRTPGRPLKDLSWLNSTASLSTADSALISPYLLEIARLQKELDRANESIDDKLDKLEEAGNGVVGLTKKLEDARNKVAALEAELERSRKRDERKNRRLGRVKCRKCMAKVDLGPVIRGVEADESSLDISQASLSYNYGDVSYGNRTSENLRATVQGLNSELDTMKRDWDEERQALLGERAVLQDTAKRLNAEIRDVKADAKSKATVQSELERAKRTITDLEEDLKAERSRLRNLTTQQSKLQNDKGEIMNQLQRTGSDMDDVKTQLMRLRKENMGLEVELQATTNAEQKARPLEKRVQENLQTIDRLRQERSLLNNDHKELQRRFAEVTDQANQLRQEFDTTSATHDSHRFQLDQHLGEIESLRNMLSEKAHELFRAELEKDKIAAEKDDVAKSVAGLERNLRRVKEDAEMFGRDLRMVKEEKEMVERGYRDELVRAERMKKQLQAQLRVLTEQLETQKYKAECAKEEWEGHVCTMSEKQLAAIKQQHKVECKGLITQIHYLKSKFTRENAFRSDLSYQKNYLLVLLARHEKSERTVLAAIARIAFPISPPLSPPTRRTAKKFKNAALMVTFVSRLRRSSDKWRDDRSKRPAITAALQDVRHRRLVKAA